MGDHTTIFHDGYLQIFLAVSPAFPRTGSFPIFSFAALVPWTFFANSLNQSSNSLVSSANLIQKVYFPRLAVPIATVFSGMVDFALAFIVLLGMMLYYGILPTVNVLWLPAFFLLALVTSLGVGLWLSAMNVRFRDVRYIVPFLVQFWMFSTPIAYPSSLLSEPWRTLYGLNPMVGVIEGFRWGLLGTNTAPGTIIIVSSLWLWRFCWWRVSISGGSRKELRGHCVMRIPIRIFINIGMRERSDLLSCSSRQ